MTPTERESLGKYVASALEYAQGIDDGDIPACLYMRQAAGQWLREFFSPPEGVYFDCAAASAACGFIEKLPHVKGVWASRNETITLEPWQRWIICTIFGWMRDDGTRRYRTAYIEVPRKNAKSTLAAGVALYTAFRDGEYGAEVLSCATKREQAKIVFDAARAMVLKSRLSGADPFLDVSVYRNNLVIDNHDAEGAGSHFAPLHSEGKTMDGLHIYTCIVDELHAWKRRDVYDVLDTARGSRAQSLMFNITTAGTNYGGVCWEIRDYAVRLLEGHIGDDSFFCAIWTIDKDDDWREVSSWKKANPNYDVSVFPMDLQASARKAEAIPSQLTAFLTKRLNVWCNASEAWMNMTSYIACGDTSLKLSNFAGEECYVGVDLASKRDMASVSLLFKRFVGEDRHYYNFVLNYLPESAVLDSANAGHYDGWCRAGYLRTTPGSILDVDRIEADTMDLAAQFRVMEVAYDPGHNSTQFGVHIAQQGLLAVEVRPTVLNFSDPMKWWEGFVLAARWHHNGDPVLTWQVSNVCVKRDQKDNIFPRKDHPDRKIDGAVATIMALNRAMAADSASTIYDVRGVVTV